MIEPPRRMGSEPMSRSKVRGCKWATSFRCLTPWILEPTFVTLLERVHLEPAAT